MREAGKAPLDDGCKITTLSNKLVFTAVGRPSDVTRGVVGSDAVAQAKELFATVSKQPRLPGLTLVNEAAGLWAQLMRRDISAHIRPEELATLKLNTTYLNGVFAGIGSTGAPEMAHIAIGRTGVNGGFWDLSPVYEESFSSDANDSL